MNIIILLLLALFTGCNKRNTFFVSSNNEKILYVMPAEHEQHEGTWLQWPHQYQYGVAYRNSLDKTWISLTKELIQSENVHIIAYNQAEKNRIIALLKHHFIPLENVDLHIIKTDDTWIRDNGPIFVRDTTGRLVVEDWGFNAWGNKVDPISGQLIEYTNCDMIPTKIANYQNRQIINLNKVMINEGGSIEIDGNGTMLACKSSIINYNRNPGLTTKQAETIFKTYLGVNNFIWLDGQPGLEITDQHIDGFAKFGNSNTIVTMSKTDLLEYGVKPSDIKTLFSAKNKNGKKYRFIFVPATKNNVVTTSGKVLGYKGSYVNYYIANQRVLVPNYSDPNDSIANAIIQTLYPSKTVVGIDVRNLYENGGMIHCITQQQPVD